ncbi:MAG TPA: 3-methyl-2-oxobutanoate hydroxymethyltransferase [Stellaceae bacterium]|nr:3-methyl-2-oxobutanoate hydroxymethyltransferase [Stellaceae bacterium]
MAADEAALRAQGSARERVTVPMLREKKARGERIVTVTAYDYPSAKLADRAGVDVVLVGDTVGMMALGYDTTVPVTLDEMVHHVRSVRRGLKWALLLADLPFGTYEAGEGDAVRNAVRLMKEGGAQAVKLEGGAWLAETVRAMSRAGIPTIGHVGLMPQSVHMTGGHKAQGRDSAAAELILEDAVALEEAGAVGIVLEAIPAALAERITARLAIPTIGIGAGSGCDGQVQVWHDLLGIPPGKAFRHVKRYASIGDAIEAALKAYADEVRSGEFPTKENSL